MVKHDDYMTPYKAWADICKYLPRDRKVWEAFRGDGTSAQHLRQLGLDVVVFQQTGRLSMGTVQSTAVEINDDILHFQNNKV